MRPFPDPDIFVFLMTRIHLGYAVGSLALVADSFHMLADVLSLVVALYAIKARCFGACCGEGADARSVRVAERAAERRPVYVWLGPG